MNYVFSKVYTEGTFAVKYKAKNGCAFHSLILSPLGESDWKYVGICGGEGLLSASTILSPGTPNMPPSPVTNNHTHSASVPPSLCSATLSPVSEPLLH